MTEESYCKMTVIRIKLRFMILLLCVILVIFGYVSLSYDKPVMELKHENGAVRNLKTLNKILPDDKVNISELELTLGVIKQRYTENKQGNKNSDDIELNINPGTAVEIVSLCTGISEPGRNTKKDEFQHLPGSDIYVYSAYLDHRVKSSRTVKVIGVSPTIEQPFYCQLYYNESLVYSVKAKAVLADKSGGIKWFKYKPHIYICEEPLDHDPIGVALTNQQCRSEITNLLHLTTIKYKPEEKIPPSVLVCVKTLYNYTHPHRLIEFLEYQHLLGASHVVLYDSDRPSNDVIRVTDRYIKNGFLSKQTWEIPLTTTKKYKEELHTEIRTYGQNAQINDCIYRFMDKYKYIVYQDPDEFIIPRDSSIKSYLQLVEDVLKRQNASQKTVSSLVFANSHFCLTGKEAVSPTPGLLTQQIWIRAKPDPWTTGGRTKYLVNPRRVLMGETHRVEKPLLHRYNHTVFVPPEVAVMHHYHRRMKQKGAGVCDTKDEIAARYMEPLKEAVNNVCTELGLPTV